MKLTVDLKSVSMRLWHCWLLEARSIHNLNVIDDIIVWIDVYIRLQVIPGEARPKYGPTKFFI